MTRFVTLFVVILVALFALELTPPAQRVFVLPWTEALARISAGLITMFDPGVAAFGKVLQDTAQRLRGDHRGRVQRNRGGHHPRRRHARLPRAPWKHRVLGILAGLAAVQALNIVRVISLFYLGQWNTEAFHWAHLYLWQALIMLDVLVVWLVWMRTLPPRGALAARQEAAA